MPSTGLAMTPSRPAPSKRWNQSAATARSRVAGVRCSGGVAPREQRLERARGARANGTPRRSRSPSQSRSKNTTDAGISLRQQLHARRGRDGGAAAAPRSRARRRCAITISPSSTQRCGQLRQQRLDQLGEVAVERLLVAALDQDLVAVAEDERAKAVPLGLEDPAVPGGQLADALGEHRQDRAG